MNNIVNTEIVDKINNRPRMRTIPKAYNEIKKLDCDTSFSLRALRSICSSGELPTVKVGGKTLINLDLLLSFLSCSNSAPTNYKQ